MSGVRWTLAVIVAAGVVAVSGCAASAPAAAPATQAAPEESATLRIAYPDGFAGPQIGVFHDALAESGDVVMEVSDEFSLDARDAEQRIIAAVASGALDVGWIGVRAFSSLGVHDFDALVAPLLIDTLAVQEVVLDSDLAEGMLAGVDALDVTGLAVVAGPIRRPVTAGAPLTSLDRFAGVTFQVFPGDVAEATLGAWGSTVPAVPPNARDAGPIDGTIQAYENGLPLLASNLDTPAKTMTLNLGLWPGVGVIVANPDWLQGLSPQQRAAVEAAADAAAERAFDAMEPESALIAVICAQDGAFAFATPDAIAGLRAAAEPVYSALAADPATAAAIDEIEQLKSAVADEDLAVPAGCRVE